MKNKRKTLGWALTMESLREEIGKPGKVNDITPTMDDTPTDMDPTRDNKIVETELKPVEKVTETKPTNVISAENNAEDEQVMPDGSKVVPQDTDVTPSTGLAVVEQEPSLVGEGDKPTDPVSMENTTQDPADATTAKPVIAGQTDSTVNENIDPILVAGETGSVPTEGQTAPVQQEPEVAPAEGVSVSDAEAAAIAAAAVVENVTAQTPTVPADVADQVADTPPSENPDVVPPVSAPDAEAQTAPVEVVPVLVPEGDEEGEVPPTEPEVIPVAEEVGLTEEEVAAQISSDENEDAAEEIEELGDSMENLETLIEENIAGVDLAEKTMGIVQDTIDNEGGLNQGQAALAEVAMEALSIITGMRHQPVIMGGNTGVSMESFGGAARLGVSTLSMESIKERVAGIKENVSAGIKALIANFRQLLVKLSDHFTNTEKAFAEAAEKLTDSDSDLAVVEFNDPDLAARLGMGGDTVSVSDLIKGMVQARQLAEAIGKSSVERANLAAEYLKGDGQALKRFSDFSKIDGLTADSWSGPFTHANVLDSDILPGAVKFHVETPIEDTELNRLRFEMANAGTKATKISTATANDVAALIKEGIALARGSNIRKEAERALDVALGQIKDKEGTGNLSMLMVRAVTNPVTVITRYNASLASAALRLVRKSLATANVKSGEGEPAAQGA